MTTYKNKYYYMIPDIHFLKHPEVIKLLIQYYKAYGIYLKNIEIINSMPYKQMVINNKGILNINEKTYQFFIEDYKQMIIEKRDQKINDILNNG